MVETIFGKRKTFSDPGVNTSVEHVLLNLSMWLVSPVPLSTSVCAVHRG